MDKIKELEERVLSAVDEAFELGRSSSEKTSPFIRLELDRAWKSGKRNRKIPRLSVERDSRS